MNARNIGVFAVFVAAVAVAAIMWSGDTVRVAHAEEPAADVVATIGETQIPLSEVDERAKRSNSQVYQQLFDARSRALNELIAERLLRAEAAKREITPDELVQQEILDKVAQVSDAQVESFFNQNRARMGGRSLDQMRDQIRNFLVAESQREARRGFIESLRNEQKVVVHLEPPRTEIEIAANDPRLGPDGAKVRIVEYSDFQ